MDTMSITKSQITSIRSSKVSKTFSHNKNRGSKEI